MEVFSKYNLTFSVYKKKGESYFVLDKIKDKLLIAREKFNLSEQEELKQIFILLIKSIDSRVLNKKKLTEEELLNYFKI